MARAVRVSEGTKIRVDSFVDNDGGKHLNVRKFYKKKDSEDWLPTRQGVTIPEDLAAKIIKAMKLELEEIDDNAKPLEAKSAAKGSKPAGKPAKKSAKKGKGK